MKGQYVSPVEPAAGRGGISIAVVLAGLVLVTTLTASAVVAEEKPRPETGSPSYLVPPVQTVDGVSFVEQGGVRVTLTVQSLSGDESIGEMSPGQLVAGQGAVVSLQVFDTDSGTPLRGLHPGAWMKRRKPGERPPESFECLEMIRRFISGGLSTSADVDLNQFYLYVLNGDRSVTVINPLISFSRTKLIAIMTLPADGKDWALASSRPELYVTLPERGSVALIDTRRRHLADEIEIGGRPGRVLAVEGSHDLWIGDEESGTVVVLDTETREVADRLSTGTGMVLLAATDDGERIFAASRDRLTIVDALSRAPMASVALQEPPVSLAVSDLAGAIFVASEGSGLVRVYDSRSGEMRAEIKLQSGLSDIAVTPDGRWGLVANRSGDTVDVFDVSTGSVTRTFDVEPSPDRIAFSDAFAYVRSRDSANLTMIQWPSLGAPGSLPVVVIPIGQAPPGDAVAAVAAGSIEAVPGGGAIVASNPMDKMLYYYGEGMMAPMGSFQNYSRRPLAVKIVDKSLGEAGPGIYSTDVLLERDGTYDLPFFLDSPRMAGCFEVKIEEDPSAPRREAKVLLQAEFIPPEEEIEPGDAVRLSFRLTDPETGKPLTGLQDVRVLSFRPPGMKQARAQVRETREGIYETELTYAERGEYYVLLSSESHGVRFGDLPHGRVTVGGGEFREMTVKEDEP